MTAKKSENSRGFEKKLEQLETMAEQMESGEMPLDDMLSAYEKGVRLAQELKKELAAAEERLTVLQAEADGEETQP